MEVWIKTLYLVYQQQLFLSSNDNDIAPINLNFLPKKKKKIPGFLSLLLQETGR